jgi:EpsD family peptidyl-prolyl cis-trans isomerase
MATLAIDGRFSMENASHILARISLAATLFCTLVVLGCSKSSDNAAKAPNGQVVAHVGDEVVTTQELENEFRLANIPVDKQKDPETLKRVMTDLVTRKYLFRQALAAKLDREPGVLLDILRSKELVLANAAISRTVAAKVSAMTKTDVDKYIANNPLKFANRQSMAVEQITFPVGPHVQNVIDSTRDMKSLDEIDQKLAQMDVPHSRSMGSVNSGDLPENLFNQMQARKPDDVFFFRAGANDMFIVVKSEEARPVGGDAAANLARQYLRADLLKSEIGMASVAANLEAKYEGDYAKLISPQAQDPAATQK